MAEDNSAGPVPGQPLSGIRVIDLTRIVSGPFCTMLLGDLGAEVIKIEPPAGDPIRAQSVGTLRGYFASCNRNKLSVVLDLYEQEDLARLKALVRTADVLVENFRTGVMARMGLGSDVLAALNPALIHCSINGFGSTGPDAERPAFDFIAQAMSGFMSVTGTPDQPMRAGPPIADLVAGLYGALATVSAVLHRVRTGEGQRVETSLTTSLMSLLSYHAASYLNAGVIPERLGNEHFVVAPYGLFSSADGFLAIAPSNEPTLRRFLAAIGLEAILEEPDFSSNERRKAHRAALNRRVEDCLRTRSSAEWIGLLTAAGVPAGEVRSLDSVFADPQNVAQHMVLDTSEAGAPVRTIGFPMKLHGTPCRLRSGAPSLGVDSDAFLSALDQRATDN
ncbi:CaiB/BaiF CoA transferase family protein [Sphingosinicella microcystinivorans]|uniref:CoA transferase n=1 Tax=Sphingosinicella microcystinivorans TaxID=335406 RepID=A0AAD1D3Y8_SPHMI|nr:CoA transferase [Sphingosinicella microcystinivorans]RKS85435.1 crotonobetainyl-CoA:carnitine CoA-transferase CaiB-like acyl-CoA transferase [Sphingosinicella microcystinivorans]BBE33275.1 CoA transferase [Sphingosinicella microcystinivorans]